jgi:hypothetical protein
LVCGCKTLLFSFQFSKYFFFQIHHDFMKMLGKSCAYRKMNMFACVSAWDIHYIYNNNTGKNEEINSFFLWKEKSLEASLQTLGASPQTFGELPQTLGELPQTLGAFPQTLGAFPQTLEELPQTLGALPQTLGALPQTLGALPQTLGASPQTLGELPQKSILLSYLKNLNLLNISNSFIINQIVQIMDRYHDYVPRQDGKLLEWVRNLLSYLVRNGALFGLDPHTWADLEQKILAYSDAYQKAEAPNRGSADVLLKNECRDTLKKVVRLYVKEYLEYNHLVTDENRKLMGLPIHDTIPTPAPVSTTAPEAEVKLPSPAVIEIHFKETGSPNKRKPKGQSGVEVASAILNEKPADWEKLIHSDFATKTPLRLTFKGDDRGKTLYFALRWQNTRGEKGPWSEIMSVIIP